MEFLKDFFKAIWVFDFEEKWGNFNYDFFGKESENFIGGYNEKNKRYKEGSFNKEIINNYYSNTEGKLYKNIWESNSGKYSNLINFFGANRLFDNSEFNKNINNIFLRGLGFENIDAVNIDAVNIDAVNISEDILKHYYENDKNIYYKGNSEYNIKNIYDYKAFLKQSGYEENYLKNFEEYSEYKGFKIYDNYKYDIKNEDININKWICKNDEVFYDKSDVFQNYSQGKYDYFDDRYEELFSNVSYGNNFKNKNNFYDNEFCYDIFYKNDFEDLNNYENHKFESNKTEKIVNMINSLYANKEKDISNIKDVSDIKDISNINEKIYSEKIYKESTDYINAKEENIDIMEKIKEELMNGLLGAEGVYII